MSTALLPGEDPGVLDSVQDGPWLPPEEQRVFTPFPKIGRLEKDMIVTEKLDGTNAAVVCTTEGFVYAQSRKRVITPSDDNYGFARWVSEHQQELFEGLGEGVHFGEWWGKGIQRGYGLDEKRFSLFNTNRWSSVHNEGDWRGRTQCNECLICHVVPVLRGPEEFSSDVAHLTYLRLRREGSMASPGFDNPEGVVVFHSAQGVLFKVSDAKVGPS